MRERLIELLIAAKSRCDDTEKCKNCVGFCQVGECLNYVIADHLLANGVIVPPCKVGDIVYKVFDGEIREAKVVSCSMFFSKTIRQNNIHTENHRGAIISYEWKDIGKTVFLTREESEQALKGGAE